MIPIRLSTIADVVGGVLAGDDAEVTAPAFLDSRVPEPDGLFVALVGEHSDGHDHAADAMAAGAAGVLGSRASGVPTVVVDDPVAALGRLARHLLDQLPDARVLALTGSQGKTGTKDYLAAALATSGPTVATRGNLNNELGVPLTVLRADPTTRYLVVEMGARGVGHIGYLCTIAPPTVAAVVNVGTAHLGEFGTREAIAQAKGEIVEALPPDGVAVLNADDPLVAAMAVRTRARVIGVGSQGQPQLRHTLEELDDLGRPRVTFEWTGDRAAPARMTCTLRQVGAHQAVNAAMALAMALAAGADFTRSARAIEEARPGSRWRMELSERADGLILLNDAYNANPASMLAAIEALAAIGRRTGRRTVAVLGEMLELGPDHDSGHREVGHAVADHRVDVLVVVGAGAASIAEGARDLAPAATVTLSAGRDDALAWLRENVRADDVVLVKASRGGALELLAQGLLDDLPEQRAHQHSEEDAG